MMRTSLVALVAAQRYFQAPGAPVGTPTANAVSYMPYGYEQAAYPSAPVAVPVAMPAASSSKGVALPLMAGAAFGATVAVLFSSGKKAAPKAKAAAKKPAAKAAPKKPVAAKKPVAKAAPAPKPAARPRPAAPKPAGRTPAYYNKTEGKGGIFPWIVSEKGTYAKPLTLSSIDFTSDAADDLIGWGAMPNSVKNLYNPKGRKGLFGGCITPAKK